MIRPLTLLLLAACGGNRDTTDTGTPPTDGTDTDRTDTDTDTGTVAEPASARISVQVAGAPVAAAPVFVADASGVWLRTLATDASGEAVLDDLPVGGSVTVGIDTGGGRRLSTVFDVQDGDVLAIRESAGVMGVPVGALTLDLEAHPTLSDGSARVFIECGGSASLGVPPVTDRAVPLGSGCAAGSTDVLAMYLESVPGLVRTRSYIRQTASLSGTAPDVMGDLSLTGWSTAHGSLAVSLTGAGAGTTVGSSIFGGFGERQNVLLGQLTATSDGSPVGISVPVDPAALDEVYGILVLNDGTAGTTVARGFRLDPVPAVGSVAPRAFVPADLGEPLTLTLVPTRSQFSTSLTGSETCSGEPVDAVGGQLLQYRTDVTNVWQFAGPPRATYALPELDPAVAGDWWSDAGDVTSAQARLLTSAGPSRSWEDWRREPASANRLLSPDFADVQDFRCYAVGQAFASP